MGRTSLLIHSDHCTDTVTWAGLYECVCDCDRIYAVAWALANWVDYSPRQPGDVESAIQCRGGGGQSWGPIWDWVEPTEDDHSAAFQRVYALTLCRHAWRRYGRQCCTGPRFVRSLPGAEGTRSLHTLFR